MADVVQRFLAPAVKHGVFELWVDRQMRGGADWDPEVGRKLRACDIFVLLVSANSMASDYVVDKEIAIIRERQAKGEDVHFYPLLLTPTPKAGLDKVRDKNLRPRDAKPFSGFSLTIACSTCRMRPTRLRRSRGRSSHAKAPRPRRPCPRPQATSTSAASPKPPTNASSAASDMCCMRS